MYNLRIKLLILTLLTLDAYSQEAALDMAASYSTDTARVFNLGEVTVMGHRPIAATFIDAGEIHKLDVRRVPEAISWLPGITISEASSRGETQLFMRGFDQTRIPVFMDGIPVYVPYDGYIDLGRLQTASVSKIEVSKGTSSLLLGGNTMGGAVNIVTTRPVKRFEATIQASTLWSSSIAIGTRQKYWYVQMDAGWIGRCNFRLPSDFRPVDGLQEGYIRHHSSTKDWQLGTKLGITPRGTDEYVLGYSLIRADKQVPPYLGQAGKARFWRYKDWDKDQFYFRSRTALTEAWKLEGRAFYDRYYNQLKAYDDNHYNTQQGKQAFNSYYDDYSLGVGASLGWKLVSGHELTLGTNLKNDVHRSHDNDDPQACQSETMLSVAVEDNWYINDYWAIAAGAGYFMHRGHTIELFEQLPDSKEMGLVNYPTSTDKDINYQLSADWRPSAQQGLRFSFSRNSRFASLKDRYSYKRGKALPNPALKTEQSYNFDLTYTGGLNGFHWYTSAYYMILANTIQEITGIDPGDPKIWQLQNRGRAHYRGAELGLGYRWRWLEIETNYSYVNRQNCVTPELKFLDAPASTVNVRLEVTPVWGIRLQSTLQARTKSWGSSDGSTYAPGFGTLNASVGKSFDELGCATCKLDIRAGITNLLDKLYYYSEGFPMEGRRFYLSAACHFSIQ